MKPEVVTLTMEITVDKDGILTTTLKPAQLSETCPDLNQIILGFRYYMTQFQEAVLKAILREKALIDLVKCAIISSEDLAEVSEKLFDVLDYSKKTIDKNDRNN